MLSIQKPPAITRQSVTGVAQQITYQDNLTIDSRIPHNLIKLLIAFYISIARPHLFSPPSILPFLSCGLLGENVFCQPQERYSKMW